MTEASERSRRLFRLQDIGIFDLRFPNPIDLGVIINGIYLIYTNVNSFAEHLQILNKSQTSPREIEVKLLTHLLILLIGVTAIWWIDEIGLQI